MKLPFKLLVILAYAALVVPTLTACGGGDKSTSSTLPSTTPPADDDDDDDDDDTPAITAFSVSVTPQTSTPVTTYLHAFNDFDSACEIDEDETTPTDLKCLLNIKEKDLFLSDTTLKVSVPGGMCKYVTEYPYWYWNAMAGTGPGTLTVEKTNGVITACSADGVAGTMNGTECEVDDGHFSTTGFSCEYNYTLVDSDYPNCCTGSYSQTTTTITIVAGTSASAGTTTSSATTTGSYGGKVGNCAAGPGVSGMSWPTSSSTGLPQIQVTYVPLTSGYAKSTTIPAEIDVYNGAYTSVYSANMYGWTDYVAGTHATATKPTGLRQMVDLSGSTLTGSSGTPYVPNSAYTYECLDNAGEVKHRIRVYINEWDTDENFTAYASGGGDTTKSPDSLPTDIEGVNCSTTTSVPGISWCDDYWDWDQLTFKVLDYPEETD